MYREFQGEPEMTAANNALPDDITVIWTCRDGVFAPVQAFPAEDGLHPGVAVVICTYRRANSLKRLLHSLAEQTLRPDELIIVDASPDEATELMLRVFPSLESLAAKVIYMRVAGALRGLTRQRNLGARFVTVDRLAYFDDDVILLSTSLQEFSEIYQQFGEEIVGVGGHIDGYRSSSLRYRIRRLLGVVSSSQPFRYSRTGIWTGYGQGVKGRKAVEVDVLPGCAMMWRTSVVQRLRFSEYFVDYSAGEDIEFSLRARKWGKLVLAVDAHVTHFHDPYGRPNYFKLGYMIVSNSYYIHRTCLENRTWKDEFLFFYARGIDLLLRSLDLIRPRRTRQTWSYLCGCTIAYLECMFHLRRNPALSSEQCDQGG